MDRKEYSYDTIIENIRNTINDKGLKQKFVAEKCGFTDQELSNILNKRSLLRAEFIPCIAVALGITPNEIFYGTEEVPA